VLIDGEKQSGGTMGAFTRMPASDIERVEVTRGSSAEFGGSSPLTVNIVLKKGVSKASTDMKASVGFREGEHNEQFSWSESGKSGDFSWILPVSLNFSRSPVNTFLDRRSLVASLTANQEFTTGVSEMEHHSFSPRLTWKSGRDSMTLSSMVFLGPSEKNTRTSGYDLLNSAENFTRNANEDGSARTLRLRLEGEKYFGESKLSGRFTVKNIHNELDITRLTSKNSTNSTISDSTKSDENEFNSAARWDQPIDLHFVSLGAEYIKINRDDTQVFTGSSVSQFNSSSQDQVLWIQDAWTPQDSVTVTGGLRIENMLLKSEDSNQQDFAALPSIAVRWQPEEAWVLRSSLGAGMKMPKLNEITATITRSVTSNTPLDFDSRGNPNLKPERSINFEAFK
jgi:iron complex outermembrane receptor protein